MSRHQEHGTSSLEAIVIWLEAIASSLEAIAIRLEVFLSQSLMCTIYQAFRSSSRVFVSLLSFLLQPFYLTLVFPCFASGLKDFVGEILQDEKWWPPPLLSTSQNNDQEVDFGASHWSGSAVPPPPVAPPTLGTGLALEENSTECLILD